MGFIRKSIISAVGVVAGMTLMSAGYGDDAAVADSIDAAIVATDAADAAKYAAEVTGGVIKAFSVDSVPNVRLVSNDNHVSDPTGILSVATCDTLNLMLRQLEDSTKAQVAVVMLPSIGETDVFDFAQDLFIKWGIGRKEANDGLLILYVEDIHTIRFQVGDGLEGVMTDAMSKRIQERAMVPQFKKGQTDRGMIEGVRYSCDVIRGNDLPWSESSSDGGSSMTLFGIVFAAIVGIAGVGALSKRFKECPECHKRGKIKKDGEATYFTRDGKEYWRQGFKCAACGYVFLREGLKVAESENSGAHFSGSGSNDDTTTSGGSWGGGSSSGGGASSCW